jgi:hypothetical protein
VTTTRILESLPEQVHHVATDKFETRAPYWTDLFNDILARYNMTLDEAWNKTTVPHRGAHPKLYHDWVHRNMVLIDEAADGDVETFQTLFQERVVDKVEANPLSLRLSYWDC